MLAESDLIAFVGVKDLPRARAFYQDVLGLPLLGEEETALRFDANGTTLRVSEVPEPARARYTVLGWEVADLVAAVRGLSDAGIAFQRYEGFVQDDLAVWTAPDGTRVAWFEDPDGNLLSLSQP